MGVMQILTVALAVDLGGLEDQAPHQDPDETLTKFYVSSVERKDITLIIVS